jgi:hypothetical protein
MRDLLETYEAQLAALPSDEDDTMTLTGVFTGPPPPEATSDRLVLKANFPGHTYPAVRYDAVDFHADKVTYRALGLLVFATIFHRACSVVYPSGDSPGLTGGTAITKLVIDSRREDTEPWGSELVSVPTAFGYWPSLPQLNALYCEALPHRAALPMLKWSNDDDMLITESDWQTRSVVYGFGEPDGAARLAALFLDLGLPGNTRTRVNLEGPAGYQSLSADSAEARLWIGYDYSG